MYNQTSYNLKNKVALVTGGACGIGRAIVNQLAEQHAFVLLTDLPSQIRALDKESLPYNVEVKELDVAEENDWRGLLNYLEDKYGKLDVLINNAGIGGVDGVASATLEEWNRIIQVNLTGPFLGMKHMIPLLKKGRFPSIINISSIYGKIGTGNAAAYHAAKAGLVGLTKTSALELAPFSIRVNTVHPGVIETRMTEKKLKDEAQRKILESNTPLPYFGTPMDIGETVGFLASEASKFINGTEIMVDGGYLAK